MHIKINNISTSLCMPKLRRFKIQNTHKIQIVPIHNISEKIKQIQQNQK